MQFAKSAFLLSLLGLAAADTCTSGVALSWPPVQSGGGGGGQSSGGCYVASPSESIVTTCKRCCANDSNISDCFARCTKASGLRRRSSADDLALADKEIRELSTRATLTCTSSETCYKYIDGSLLCLNLATGQYHDAVGGTGNYNSGVYTNPNGQVQTGTSAPATTSTGRTSTTSSSRSQSAAAVPGSTTSATGMSTRVGSSTSAAATSTPATGTSSRSSGTAGAATATSTSGGDSLYPGAVVGVLGVVAGLVL